MTDIKDIIANIEHLYSSNDYLDILKDFERVLDELNLYVFDNWEDGELVSGPHDSKYFVKCTFMWPKEDMPDPAGGMRLLQYDIDVKFAESIIKKVRKIRKPDDIRPGTRKGKIDMFPVWMVEISMPKKLMSGIQKGRYAEFTPKDKLPDEKIQPAQDEMSNEISDLET